MLDFFISYTHTDQAWAEWIAWNLEEAGFTTHIQAWDFRPGSNFIHEMQKGSSEAARTLVVLSSDYLRSGFAASEWMAAFAQDPTGEKGKVLPVRVRRVTPEGLLRSIVYIDLVGLGESVAREKLLGGLSRGRAKPTAPPIFPGEMAPRFPGEPSAPIDPGEAAARLNELPVDYIPEPGPLPPGSRMPLAVNPLFVGRQEDLRVLARSLKVEKTAAIGQVEIAAATGLGGIGKTQLASEFAHRYGRFFAGGVFWMSFADPASVPAEVASCGRGLGLRVDYDALAIDQQVRLTAEAWQSSLPRLLVFDNCEEVQLLDRWRPRSGGARVLVTSRRSRWDPAFGVKVLPLGTLERSASLQLLRRFRPDLPAEEPALSGIAAELGDLPLALHLAGSFLARYREAPFGQPQAYLEQLRRGDLLSHPSLQGKGAEISPTGHEAHVARTFALSYERLDSADQTDVLAQKILARAGYFASGEPILRGLLLATLQMANADFEAILVAEDALDRLIALGLLENRGGPLILHRLVAAFARGQEEAKEARQAVEETLIQEAMRLNAVGYPAPLLAWQPHLRALAEGGWDRYDLGAAAVCAELANHLFAIGDYAGSRRFYERALSIHEKTCDHLSSEVAQSLSDLGELSLTQDDLEAACSFLERALEIRKRVLGMDHLKTADSLVSWGALLARRGDLTGAQIYQEQALAIRENLLGSEHAVTAASLYTLGFTLAERGDLDRARELLERALQVEERQLGLDHPSTAKTLGRLANVLQRGGDLAGARSYLERMLSTVERTLGMEHPDRGEALAQLGGIFLSQGNLKKARDYMLSALEIWEHVLGPTHVRLVSLLTNIGGVFFRQRDLTKARQHFARALSIAEATLEIDHPTIKYLRRSLKDLKRGAAPGRRPIGRH
jgi:tetratricopeptide (TPR) repeat protein